MYITNNDVLTLISGFELANFTDDGQTGQINQSVLDNIMQMASDQADSYVASIYTTPFPLPYPSKIKNAALIFACEALYTRRLSPDEKNPFKTRADTYRQLLEEVGSGHVPLDANFPRSFTPGTFVITKSRVNPPLRPPMKPWEIDPDWM